MNTEILTIDQLEKASNMLKAIAHPVRLSIVSLLKGNKQLSVSEIHENLQLKQATTSHHLGIMKDKDVLSSKRIGKNTYYFLKYPNLINVVACVSNCCT